MNFILINLLRFMTLIDLGRGRQFVVNVVRQLEIVARRYMYLEFCFVM